MRCLDFLKGLLLLGAALAAQAETVVTACGTDNAAGGVNLVSALATGGDIRIACAGGPNEIKLTGERVLSGATTIDGGGATLSGTGNGVMFVPAGPARLTLRNLTLSNPPANPADPNMFTGIVYDRNDLAVVELNKVTVTDTRLPFAVRKLVARASTFARNGDARQPDFGVVMAGELELEQVAFRDNLSRPFHALWRSDPVTSGRQISAQVRKCSFERNKRPAFWAAGELVIDQSSFTDNGDALPFAAGGRGWLYANRIYLELARSAAGAVEVAFANATISRSSFKNNRGMLGGAMLAARSTLTLQSSDFEANHALSGGALAYLSPAGSNPLNARLRLRLGHVKLRDNQAAKDGGALLLLGDVAGDAVQMSRNKAGESGGAVALVSASASPMEAVPADVGKDLPAPGSQPTRLELTRVFVLDNTATQHVIDAGAGIVRLANALLARNVSTAGGAALFAQNVEVANSTLIGNQSEGLHLAPGGTVGASMANVIVAGNQGNCANALATLKLAGANLQYPDAGCGATIPVADPSLDARFAPTMSSPARNAGSLAICAAHDLVDGRDLYGNPRSGASCAIGAVEADLVNDLIRKVGAERFPWLLFGLIVFLLICLLIGIVVGCCRRRKKNASTACEAAFGRRGEGYVFVQMILLALVVFAPSSWPGAAWTAPCTWLGKLFGGALLAIGITIALLACVQLGKNLTPLPQPRKDAVLVVSGIYRLVRHPIYSGLILAAFGWALWLNGWLTLGYALLLLIFLDIKSRREEIWLAEKFPEYHAYRQRVRKLLPYLY